MNGTGGKEINVKILAGSWAKQFVSEEMSRLALGENATVSDILDILNIPQDETGLTVINGKATRRDAVLCDGDRIEIFPVIVDG